MFDPTSITFAQASQYFKDFSIIGVILYAGWYIRKGYELVTMFFARTINHMNSMETFARTVVDNHLKHIEADLKVLSGRTHDIATTRNTSGEEV